MKLGVLLLALALAGCSSAPSSAPAAGDMAPNRSSGGHGGSASDGGGGGGPRPSLDLAVAGDLAVSEPPDFGDRQCLPTCNSCVSGVCCGGGCCAPGEWCDNNACHCANGPACAPGQACASGGPEGLNGCGWICCGQGVPCPL
jgi:hypothetical protein